MKQGEQPKTKITVEVPTALLAKACRAGNAGITGTVRAGLEVIAATESYARLRSMRGKVRFPQPLSSLKYDR